MFWGSITRTTWVDKGSTWAEIAPEEDQEQEQRIDMAPKKRKRALNRFCNIFRSPEQPRIDIYIERIKTSIKALIESQIRKLGSTEVQLFVCLFNEIRIFLIASKILISWDNCNIFSPAAAIFLLLRDHFCFSWVVWKGPEIGKNRKEIKWLLLSLPKRLESGELFYWLRYLDNSFFKRFSIKFCIWRCDFFFYPWGVAPENGSKLKKWVRTQKQHTKSGITQNWNELRPKFFQ